MPIPVFIIDTFTSTPFHGNPTTVCLINKPIPQGTMLSMAKEFNFPVTAFIEKDQQEKELYHIKYFTVSTEIPACGHATLASAKAVLEQSPGVHPRFKTIEQLVIDVKTDGDLITMTYPKYNLANFSMTADLLRHLSLKAYKSAGFCRELETLFIEVEDPAVLRNLQPDFKALVADNNTMIEIVVTSLSEDAKYDFLLRSFCPWIGIDEDPVTGSVHSVLAGFWKDRLGKSILTAYQASERGGEVYLKAFDNKVELGGKAVVVLKGSMKNNTLGAICSKCF